MRTGIIALLILILTNLTGAQNWYTIAGNNQKNGVTKLTGPATVSSTYWSVSSTNSSVWGNTIYTWNNMFVTARITFSPYYSGKIELRSLTNGSLIWEKTIADTSIMYAVGFNEDAVYACDYKTGILYALKISDGSVLWSVTSNMFPGNTGICFAPNGDPIIFGKRINRKTGIPVWTNNYTIPVGPDGGYVVSGNTYYHWTGSIVTPKQLIAIDINSGVTKYLSAALPGDGDQENDLTIGPDGTIYIARDGGALHSFTDNGSGFSQKWTLTPAVLVKSFGPDNILYCANVNYGLNSGKLMRVNGLTGQVIDSVSSNIPAGYVTVGFDSTVYVTTVEAANGRYFAFTPDLQTIKWQLNVPYNYYSGCPIGKEGVFITAGSGTQINAYKPIINRKPVADFYTPVRDTTAGSGLNFFDLSSYSPTEWQWDFGAGTPSTSTQQNPSNIQFPDGIHQVQLIVLNSYGSDTLIKYQYINITSGSGITKLSNGIPKIFILKQNYPNPFNPSTSVEFDLNVTSSVSLKVYDIKGREIESLLNNNILTAGRYKIYFNGNKLSSGLYFYNIRTDKGINETKTMLLVK
ncbi:MAG: PQQ-binding-like beta-propeller repeat protein [Ignavibacteria bacterium]|nr:PQQ-binding-like beta-propeller repeat protein [Ignavibacteria bacterium]